MLLKPQSFTIEFLEDVELDEPIIERLKELKEAGFTLALDDYIGTPIPKAALELMDIIKVDFLLCTGSMRKKIAQTFCPIGKTLLAEKVESRQDYEEAIRLGYELFQGFYFVKPVVLKKKGKDIASSSYLKLMKKISARELDYRKISDIVYTDAHLTYHLLKKMQKLQYYRSHTVQSVRSAESKEPSHDKERLSKLLVIAEIYENGQWAELKEYIEENFPSSDPKALPDMYLAAVRYSDEVFSAN